jgi:hypothetical protein
MKKSFIVITLFVITMFVSDLKATCPPGFQDQTTSSFVTCAGCHVTVTFCRRWNIELNAYDVYIGDISYTQDFTDACLCGTIVQQGTYRGPDIDMIFEGILNNNQAMFGYAADLVECAPIMNEEFKKMKVYSGGCYIYTPPSYPDMQERYTACNPYLMGECREYYTICKELINNIWVIKVKSDGPPNPTFICNNPEYEPGCTTICR